MSESAERLTTSLAITADVDTKTSVVIAETTLCSYPRQFLDRLQRRAPRTDQKTEIRTIYVHFDVVRITMHRRGAGETERIYQALQEPLCFIAHFLCIHCALLRLL